MEKTKQKINAKKFLQDFRSGVNDDNLLDLHGLNPQGYDKLLNLLENKGLLTKEDWAVRRKALRTAHADEPVAPPPVEADPAPQFADVMPSGLYQTHTDVDTCPQCGVAVGKNALMCQECGHVLTGQERWAQVEPKKRLVDRVPPLVLGTIIALPIGVLMFFLFKDVILPMSEGAGEKRAQPVRKETGGKPAMQVARDLATVGSSGVIKNEVQRLMAEEIISNHTPDYAYFTAGSRWAELSEEARRKELENLRKSLRASRIPAFFKFVMPDGEPYASVGESRIEINVELEKRLAYPDGMAPFRPIEIPPELGGGPSAPHAEPEVGEETQSPPARKLPRGM